MRTKLATLLNQLSTALQKVFCNLRPSFCTITHLLKAEDYVLGSPANTSIEHVVVTEDKRVKYLPMFVGEKFPNLKGYNAWKSGLTVVRNHYFKNMKNLEYLTLSYNQIAAIEANAFRDLVNVNDLKLGNNMIETLDEKLFATMIKLQELDLNHNKIKFLAPATFKIPYGELNVLDLSSNVCIDEWYGPNKLRSLTHLKSDLKTKCSGSN